MTGKGHQNLWGARNCLCLVLGAGYTSVLFVKVHCLICIILHFYVLQENIFFLNTETRFGRPHNFSGERTVPGRRSSEFQLFSAQTSLILCASHLG